MALMGSKMCIRDRVFMLLTAYDTQQLRQIYAYYAGCLLYTSSAMTAPKLSAASASMV